MKYILKERLLWPCVGDMVGIMAVGVLLWEGQRESKCHNGFTESSLRQCSWCKVSYKFEIKNEDGPYAFLSRLCLSTGSSFSPSHNCSTRPHTRTNGIYCLSRLFMLFLRHQGSLPSLCHLVWHWTWILKSTHHAKKEALLWVRAVNRFITCNYHTILYGSLVDQAAFTTY